MNEISLHLLDIAENSISAGSSRVTLRVEEFGECLTVSVEDDGRGMDEAFLKRVVSPFSTTRTTRKVGLGIPMFKQAAELAGGTFSITSQKGVGTRVEATFGLDHIDRMPMGDIASTLTAMVMMNPEIEYALYYTVDEREFAVTTSEMRAALGDDVPLSSPEVIGWLAEYIREGIREIKPRA